MAKTIRNVHSFQREKNIFCIEGSWVNDHRSKTSVKLALDFLECIEGIKPIVKQCQNKETLKELLEDCTLSKYKKYNIIYLAFHGTSENIFVGKRNKTVNLDEIAEMIGDKANGKIIHFGCCSTLDTTGWKLRSFLNKTGALAISGYNKDIDFTKSTAFDLMYFQQCHKTTNIIKIEKEMKAYHNKLGKELGFVIKYWK